MNGMIVFHNTGPREVEKDDHRLDKVQMRVSTELQRNKTWGS